MSGYHLHQGVSLEAFPVEFPHLFLQEHPLSDPVYVVVQNAGLGEWLTRSLARQRGAVMGMRILMPEQALRRFAGGFSTARRMVSPDGRDPGTEESTLFRGEGRGLLFMDSLKLAVFKALEEVLADDDPLYFPVRDYARNQGLRLWQLSDSLAGTFYHYGMNCLPLVEAWDAGASYPGLSPLQRAAEAWQRGLWRRIFHDRAPYTHLSRVLSETMASTDSYDGPEARVVLFGSMFLGETGLRFFRHLAGSLDVHHFLFTPSALYARGEADSDHRDTAVPFLGNNGRLSADFASLVPSLSPDALHWHPGEEPADTMLARVRTALAGNRPLDGTLRDDGSIAIHDAVGIRRQVEVLKDRILEALREDRTLAPTDIGVLAPDISQYAPYIESVFRGAGTGAPDELIFNLSDLPGRGEAPYPAAFSGLLELVGSRFGRNSLTALFDNPCFTPCSGHPELALSWRRMADELGVRWGTDRTHRESGGAADPVTGSWEHAFRRLLCAYYWDEGDDPGILPANLPGDTRAEEAGRLIRTVRMLESDLRTLEDARLPLREWILRWERIIDTWLKPRTDSEEDEADRLRIKGAVRDLMALDEDVASLADFGAPDLPWPAFSAMLEEKTASVGGRRGRYLARGVTCASLKPMRAIPFRRIYVLGMDEGAWPGREYLTGFDLRDAVDKAIDLSRESVDRFAFLETLFAASEHLSFFYSGRDAERGEPQAPSSPLVEFCDYLGPDWPLLQRTHPLVPFDPAALGEDLRLQSSSREALALAESLRDGPPTGRREDGPLSRVPREDSVDWKDLAFFLRDPLRFFYRETLGVHPGQTPEEEGEEDVLEPGELEWWQWKNRIIREDPGLLAHPRALVDGFSESLRLSGAVATTPFSALSGHRRLDEALSLAEQLKRLETEGLALHRPFSVLLDPAAAGADGRPSPGEEIRVPAPRIRLDDGRVVAVTGRVPGLRLLMKDGRPDEGIWTGLDFISGNRVKSRHLLTSWTAALILGSTGSGPAEYRVFRLGGHDFPARRYFFGGGDDSRAGGGERRRLSDAAAVLESLVRIREQARRRPLILHHEVADELMKAERRSGPLEGDGLAAAARDGWTAILGNTEGYSSLRDCPYRSRFLGEPDFSSGLLGETWQRLYHDGGLA